jgi:hypothetical protein
MTISPIDIVGPSAIGLEKRRRQCGQRSYRVQNSLVSETKQISQPPTRILAIIRRDRLAEI